MNTKLVPAICTQCGGQVEVDAQLEAAVCRYCGVPFIVEKAINTYNIQHATIEHVDSINIVTTNPVESVLNFVKDQQKRNDDIKREKEEQDRKERERIDAIKREEEEQQKKAKEESDKSFKKYWWAYLLAIVIPLVLLNFMGTQEKNSTEISINSSSSELEKKNYKDVVIQLQGRGFTNIKTEAIEDLVLGWLTKDGDVERVEINGNSIFSSSTKFPKDAEVKVTYHTFKGSKDPTPSPAPSPTP
jgi:hypothetical protein